MKTIKKLKGLLKAVVFTMLMVFVLHGCDDEQNVSNESDNHEIMIKHLSENDLLKNDFIKEIADKIKDISTKKNITSSDSTFVIKTKSFYKTTLDSVTNYSFLLLRNDKEYGKLYYENFIVTEINNVYSFSIAKFNMENSELLSLETVDSNLVSLQQIIDTTTKMELMDDCIKVEYLPCDGNGTADGHDAVEGYCHGSATVLDFSDCSGGAGPSGSSNGSPNQGTGEETTNTDNTNNSSTSSVVWHPSPSSFGATTVVILDYGQNAVDNFFDNLTVNEQNAIPPIIKKKISAYIYSNFSEVNQAGVINTTIFYNIITWLANNNNQSNVLSNCIAILDFLNEDGNNTPEAQDFAQEVMDAMEIYSLSQEVYSISNYPGKNLNYPFEWWKDNNFIINSGNFDLPIPNQPNEEPNAKEVLLFSVFSAEAISHIQNATQALSESQIYAQMGTFGQTGNKALNNGKADAFRHAYWNALGVADFGSMVMKLFADAHEWSQSGVDVVMDLNNNEVGRNISIANNYGLTTSDQIINTVVKQSVLDGYTNYLFPTGSNGEILPNSTNIPTNQ